MAQHHPQYPVSISPSFFHASPSSSLPVDALHALRYDDDDDAAMDGGNDGQLTLDADADSKEIRVAAGTNVAMSGRMQRIDNDELECVLLWEESTKVGDGGR